MKSSFYHYERKCARCRGVIPTSRTIDDDVPSLDLCPRCLKIEQENARAARQGDGQARLLV